MEGCFVAGADPELMVIQPDGNLTSAIPLIAGTKKEPLVVAGGAVQRDNVMAEFNVTPGDSLEEFEHNMRQVLGELSKMVAPNLLKVQASADYPTAALDHDEAKVFGCDPDWNSWAMRVNEFDTTQADETFRSAGGHWHVGHKPETQEMLEDPYGKAEVIKLMDIFMGVPSILLDSDPTSAARRRLYGRAGAHRPKDYGVEYRTLGNFWVSAPSLVETMYRLSDLAVRLCVDGESESIIERVTPRRVVKAINTSDSLLAKEIVEKDLAQYLEKDLFTSILTEVPLLDLYSTWQLAA